MDINVKTAPLSDAGDKTVSYLSDKTPQLTIQIAELITENVHVPAQSITLVSTEIDRLYDFLKSIKEV